MQNEIMLTNHAGLGRRFVALFFDGMILAVFGIIAGHLIPFLGGILLWFFYAPILEASSIRATIGKHLMGIQVGDLNGQRISFQTSLIRNAMKILSTCFCFIGFLFAFFTSRKQALHDLVADTTVINGESQAPIADAWLETVKGIFASGKKSFGGSTATPQNFEANNDSMVAQLERLQTLKNQGALTETEYEAAKARILAR